MRWDSPIFLSAAGTIAVHLILFVVADAMQVYRAPIVVRETPRIEMVEIEVPPVLAEPPPPPPPAIQEPEPAPPPPERAPDPPKRVVTTKATVPEVAPTTVDEPPPQAAVPDNPGGEQVVTLDSASAGPNGVPVAVGRRTSERVGRGGAGGGTGAGSGSGASAEAPKPVSVATIKKRALPKGDQSYFDAGKDYPAEAKQMGVEGIIRVRLVVDETGKVSTAVLLNKLGHGLDELALERAKLIVFDPAISTDDKPVSSVVVWTFTMTLPK